MAVTPYLVSFLRYSEILVENHDFFHTTMHAFNTAVMGSPSEYCHNV